MTRRRERGLATTEATLSLPVLSLLIAGALHLQGLLQARLAVGLEARRAVWAMRDDETCAAKGRSRVLSPEVRLPGEVLGLLPGAMDAIIAYGRARGERTTRTTLAPLAPTDRATRRLRDRAVVTCNEPARDGLLDALGEILSRVAGL